MKQKRTSPRTLLAVLVLALIAISFSATAFAEEGEPEEIVEEIVPEAVEVQLPMQMGDGEPMLGTAPPMDPAKRPDYKLTWADKVLPEFGEKVGQYEVKEGEFYVLQTVLSDGKSNHMDKRLIYVDRVYEAPGIIWGTRRTIDYTDANTGEHRKQDISGWTPESVMLFVPETNRLQNKIG